MLDAFARRLREERLKASANQSEFAEWGGAKKNTQMKYERAETSPTVEYLLNLEKHGVDIGYLITGVHNEDGTLGGIEAVAINMFRKLSAREREAVMTLMSVLTAPSSLVAPAISANLPYGGSLQEQKQSYRPPDQEP